MTMRVVPLLLLCACAGGAKKTEDLLFDLRTFQEGLRWRKYEMAADYVPPAVRDKFLDAHDDSDDDLRIDDYELLRVEREGDGARVRVKYTWHLNSVGSVHDTVFDERWERQGRVWRITENEHRRGEPMPQQKLGLDDLALP